MTYFNKNIRYANSFKANKKTFKMLFKNVNKKT